MEKKTHKSVNLNLYLLSRGQVWVWKGCVFGCTRGRHAESRHYRWMYNSRYRLRRCESDTMYSYWPNRKPRRVWTSLWLEWCHLWYVNHLQHVELLIIICLSVVFYFGKPASKWLTHKSSPNVDMQSAVVISVGLMSLFFAGIPIEYFCNKWSRVHVRR